MDSKSFYPPYITRSTIIISNITYVLPKAGLSLALNYISLHLFCLPHISLTLYVMHALDIKNATRHISSSLWNLPEITKPSDLKV